MNQTDQMKQIGGVWIEDDVYLEFKKIAKAKGFRKPTELISDLIRGCVSENSKIKKEWIDRSELIEEILSDKKNPYSVYTASTLEQEKLPELQDKLPTDCVKGGNERGKKVLFHKDKTLQFLKTITV